MTTEKIKYTLMLAMDGGMIDTSEARYVHETNSKLASAIGEEILRAIKDNNACDADITITIEM